MHAHDSTGYDSRRHRQAMHAGHTDLVHTEVGQCSELLRSLASLWTDLVVGT